MRTRHCRRATPHPPHSPASRMHSDAPTPAPGWPGAGPARFPPPPCPAHRRHPLSLSLARTHDQNSPLPVIASPRALLAPHAHVSVHAQARRLHTARMPEVRVQLCLFPHARAEFTRCPLCWATRRPSSCPRLFVGDRIGRKCGFVCVGGVPEPEVSPPAVSLFP